MDMTNIDAPGRFISLEMAQQHIKERRVTDQTAEERADSVLSILSLMVYDTTEADLRDWLTLGGLDLTNYAEFELAREYVSLFVAAGALEIDELFSFSLVDLGTNLVSRYAWDEELQARLDKVKTDGIFFRDFVAPYVEV